MAGKYWTTEPEVELPIRIGESGYAAAPAKTFIDVLKESVKKHGDRNALGQKKKVGDQPIPEEWTFWTYKQYYADCMRFAKVLHHFNVDNHKIVNILGFNAPEWLIANTGAMLAGCIATGIYATNTPEACHYITQHSKAEILVVEDNNQLKKYANPKVPMPELKAIVLYHEKPDPKLVETVPFPTFYWPDFLDIGNNVLDEDIEKRHSNIRPGHCASLIYTSGTTGPPKAVMISHDNIVWTATNICIHYMNLSHEDRVVSYLPLSHIAAQLIDIYCMGVLGACTYFCQPDALKGTLTVTMKDVLPTFFFRCSKSMGEDGREDSTNWTRNASWTQEEHINMGKG
jgi:long-chain-fatty-acid--CoA ligase ACSBG